MRSVELFAGCGGLALGVAQAGFEHDTLIELDPDAIGTLLNNKVNNAWHIRDANIAHSDIRQIDFRAFEQVDLLSGGPPCQPFSIGGRHLGPHDDRNMWSEVVRAVRQVRPKTFMFENVRGLFRPSFSQYLEYIKLQLSYPHMTAWHGRWEEHLSQLRNYSKDRAASRWYRVIAKVIDAADYGAAQKRHRIIFMGAAVDCGEEWDFPAPTHSQDALIWSKYITGEYWTKHGVKSNAKPTSLAEVYAWKRLSKAREAPKQLPWVTVRDSIGDLPRPTKTEAISGHWQHPGARAYPRHTGSCWDEPAKALKAGHHGVPGGENMLANGNGQVRYFTVREMARLQGLPDDYEISGNWKAATRQLGNAAPTVIGRSIGKTLRCVAHGPTAAAITADLPFEIRELPPKGASSLER